MEIKENLLSHLHNLYQQRIDRIQMEIQSLTPSRESETKNSAGDKHETSRAMMHIELDNHKKHLAQILAQKNDLNRVDTRLKHHRIEFGSIALTSQGNYFFSVGIGKLIVEGKEWYCVSMVSPVGMALQSKCAGEEVLFNNIKIKIEEIF